MNIAIVTNMNGIGLQRDYELLCDFLAEEGHNLTGIQFDEPIDPLIAAVQEFNLAIFLEVVPREKLNVCDRRWLIANPEWIKRDAVDVVNKCFEKVFAKTREGVRVLEKLFPKKVHYVGFMARDRWLVIPSTIRKPWFLHIGGNSSLRGTQAVVDAWKWEHDGKRIDAPLIVVSRALKDRPPLPNVTYYDIIDDDELWSLQNECAFHLYPSGTEGFGHAIHEAMSTDNTLIVTGEPPLDEIKNAIQLPSCGKTSYNFATVYEVSAIEIYRVCQDLLRLWQMDRRHVVTPRQEFLDERESFKKLFRQHLEEEPIEIDAPPIAGASPRPFKEIAFLGNFENEESTENMVKWALEHDGHTVVPIQENHLASMKLLEQMTIGADVFLWIHTYGWFKHPDEQILDFFAKLERRGVRTVSMHLDKFWGIPEREKRIGIHPFWKTQHVFTADGGFQLKFKERGVNHSWLRPAVSRVYCHPGTPRQEFMCDVGFVGAKDYHQEYPFRKELVEFLEAEYSGRFMHVQGVRGHRLNDFYASCKVVVGDCIFAGTPLYWSDRVPETCGRGGFLLHPEVPGFLTPTPTYDPQDLVSLKEELEKWLVHPERRYILHEANSFTLANDTWSVRMREILKQIYE